MGTIADKLNYLQNTKAAIKQAIIDKGVTVTDNDSFRDYATKIGDISTGTPQKDVILYTPYGEEIASYTKEQFLNLSSYPEAPALDRLTFQEYNWSLTDAKTYVTNYGMLYIGAIYKPTSEKTEIDITLNAITGLQFKLCFTPVEDVTIDWGDDNTETITNTTNTHTYSNYGNYTVKIGGNYNFNINSLFGQSGNTGSENKTVNKILIANNIIELGSTSNSDLLSYCFNLKYVILPSSVQYLCSKCFDVCHSLEFINFPIIRRQSYYTFGRQCFGSCNNLKNLILSHSNDYKIYLSNAENFLANCTSLKIITLPPSIDTITSLTTYMFQNCYSLTKVICPLSKLGSYMFNGCSSLNEIILPNTVSLINDCAFQGCRALKFINTNITELKKDIFKNCNSLEEIPNLSQSSITDGTTTNGLFNNCYNLKEVTLPNNLSDISTGMFNACYKLKKIKLPSLLQRVNSAAFTNCFSILEYDFSDCNQVPTLSSTNAFTNISSQCKIIVPDSLYDSWIAANNWSTYANYIYKASEVS